MRQLLIKILAKDKGFRQAMISHIVENKPSIYKDNMEFAFKDSEGRSYFFFPDLMKMPYAMVEKLQELQGQLEAKIPGKDLDLWINAFEAELNDEKRKDKIVRACHWVTVLKERRSVLADPTILLEIAALLYIREDEDPTVYNRERHMEKYDMLWKDSREGQLLYDFFIASGLKAFMPSGGVTQETWSQYLPEILEKIKTFNQRVSAISTSASGLG